MNAYHILCMFVLSMRKRVLLRIDTLICEFLGVFPAPLKLGLFRPVALPTACAPHLLRSLQGGSFPEEGLVLYTPFAKGMCFFSPMFLKVWKVETGGDIADAETPTSRQLYIYTSATQHPRIRDSKIKNMIFYDTGASKRDCVLAG